MFPTPGDFKEILNVVYVSVVRNFAATITTAVVYKLQSMLLSSCVNVVYVAVILCNIAAS